VEAHGRDPTHLEFFKETHSKEGGSFVVNAATEGFLAYVFILLLVILSFLFLWTNYDTNSISS